MISNSSIYDEIEKTAASHPGLRLFVLFGSRARGNANEYSDWDFGYLGDDTIDIGLLHRDLVLLVNTNHVDLVNLAHAGGLLRYRAARDGILLYEQANQWRNFWLESVNFWCDVEPILTPAYNNVLKALG